MKKENKIKGENPMRKIKIAKVTLNMGCGGDQGKAVKAAKLLKLIAEQEPIPTFATKRIPEFGVRPGLLMGYKVTLRGKKTEEIIKKLLGAKDNKLKRKQFNPSSVSFGIKEYIQIPGMQFQRDVGIMGLECCIDFERAGWSITRKKKSRKIPKRHKIEKEEIMKFMEENFNTTLI
ncbi:50S ribosomal protein L5 [Candidatus Pacearchaeota archaeon CG06_land_8_20_14_3_00_35_12]|nr:MAG: 50S ribosomal protein L5 [Candidatus Pacearchaeota archaeon CG06_land_8_20_14_3_00_35_12]